MGRRWWWMVVALAVGGCGSAPTAASPNQPTSTGSAPVANMDGASLDRVQLGDGSIGYLQRIDVRKMRIDQILGERDTTQPGGSGAYYPKSESPRFRRITAVAAQDRCRSTYGAKAFSVVNFSFFEQYDDSTQLSFPVKTGGTLISGGSSPYGPVATPKHSHYRTVTLKALQWNAQAVTIGDYDPRTGAPLNQASTRDAVVTYSFTDHPSYVLDKDPANRYQLLGVVDSEQLLILTVEHTTLARGADLLRQLGVRNDVLTFDGGVSTYLWSRAAGVQVDVTNGDKALPHYLCIHA